MKKEIKVLSVKQPWAWAIFKAGKDVENRSRRMLFVGRIYIASCAQIDYKGMSTILHIHGSIPDFKALILGSIIGYVDLLGCKRNSTSPWAVPGMYHLILKNPVPIKPIPIKGQQNIFNYTIEV